MVGVLAVAFLVWSVILGKFVMKKIFVLAATMAAFSSSAMAYTQRDVDRLLNILEKEQAYYVTFLSKGYGLSQEVTQAVVSQTVSYLNDHRITELFLKEAEANPKASPETLSMGIAKKGYLRLPPEDVVFATEFYAKMISSLPDESCKAMSMGKDTGALSHKPDKNIAAFFASQNPSDVVRYLCMDSKAIRAEVEALREPAKNSPRDLKLLQQAFATNYQRILSSYSELDQARMLQAVRDPKGAPACDVCKAFKMTFKVYESLDPKMKTVYSYSMGH